MATEELKIKITVDDSEVNAKAKLAKKTLQGIGDGASEGAREGAKGFDEMCDSIDKLKNRQWLEILSNNLDSIKKNLAEAKKHTESFSSSLKSASEWIKMAGADFGQIFSKEYWKDTGVEELSDAMGTIAVEAGNAGQSLKRAGKDVVAAGKEGGKAVTSLGAAFKAAIGGTAVASIALVVGAVALLIASIKNAITVTRQLAAEFYEAQKIGLNLNQYREWGYVLESVGVGVDKLSDFMKTLADEQNAVREGDEGIIAAFGKLGISAEEAANMTQNELFTKTVEGLQGIENEVERTSIAYKIFGEDAAQLTNVLNLSNGEMQTLLNNYALLGGNVSDNLTNKSLSLKQALSNLSVAWGGLKNTLAEWVIPAVKTVVNWLAVAIAKFNILLRAILGYDVVVKNSSSNASSGMGDYKKQTEGAQKAVEKLKRTTMGFDELNIVRNPNSNSGGGSEIEEPTSFGGGGIGEGLISADALEGIQKFAEKVNRVKELLAGFVPVVLTAIGLIGCVLCIMSGNIPGAIAMGAIAGLGISIGVANGTWKALFGVIWEVIKAMWDGIVLAAKDIWACIKSIGKVFVAVGVIIGVMVADTVRFIAELVVAIAKGLAWIGVKIWDGIVWAATKVGEGFMWVIEKIGEGCTWIGEKLGEFWDWIKNGFNQAIEWIKNGWNTMKTAISEKLTAIKDGIVNTWNTIAKWFSKNVAPKFTRQYWADKFESIRQSASEKLTAAKEKMTGIWGNISSWFSTKVKPKFTATYWKNIFKAIPDGIKTAMNNAIKWIESGINNILNKFHSSNIGAVIDKVAGGLGVSIPRSISIPRLATGGIATRSTIANIGEAGREAVLPLDRNTEWMDALADKIASRQGGGVPIVLQVDGKTFAQTTVRTVNALTKQTGRLQLNIV